MITEVERQFTRSIARCAVQLEELLARAESDLAAGRDLGMSEDERDMVGEQLADQIEDIAYLRGY